jgi:hypothetical protein
MIIGHPRVILDETRQVVQSRFRIEPTFKLSSGYACRTARRSRTGRFAIGTMSGVVLSRS